MPTRWIVVTGAAGGLGQAVVERCLKDGFRVLALCREEPTLEVGLLDPRVDRISIDLRDPGLAEAVARRLESNGVSSAAGVIGAELSDRLAGVAHVAGISRGAPLSELKDDDWAESLDVNVSAPMRLSRRLLPYLESAGGASIVHVSSPVALVGARKVSYAASKAALHGLAMAMAAELGPRAIRVNVVLPGLMKTGMTADWPAERFAAIAAELPLRKIPAPEDVAAVVSFLLGPDSACVTGAVIDATGGAFLRRP